MARKVNFEEAPDTDRLYNLLSVDETEGSEHPYRDWEVLREIERQEARRQYDRSPERRAKRKEMERKSKLTRQYINDHPEEVAKILAKHGEQN